MNGKVHEEDENLRMNKNRERGRLVQRYFPSRVSVNDLARRLRNARQRVGDPYVRLSSIYVTVIVDVSCRRPRLYARTRTKSWRCSRRRSNSAVCDVRRATSPTSTSCRASSKRCTVAPPRPGCQSAPSV